MTRSILAPLACLLLLCGRAFAVDQAGTSGASFLRMEQGARPIGMGGAYSALADDAASLWWNPAGIARSAMTEFTFSHAALIESISTEYIGFIKPVSRLRGTLGASFTYLSIPGLEGYDASKNSVGKLTANAYAGSLAYGFSASTEVSVGANAKFIGQKLASESGSGMALDLGAQYRKDYFGLGVAVQNLGPAFKIGGTSDPLPRTIRGGLFYAPVKYLILAADEEKPLDAAARFHIGGEWQPAQFLSLRAGFQQTPNVGSGAGFTLGFGFAGAFGGSKAGGWGDEFTPAWDRLLSQQQDLKKAVSQGAYLLGIDYAFLSNGDLADIHRVSLSVRF